MANRESRIKPQSLIKFDSEVLSVAVRKRILSHWELPQKLKESQLELPAAINVLPEELPKELEEIRPPGQMGQAAFIQELRFILTCAEIGKFRSKYKPIKSKVKRAYIRKKKAAKKIAELVKKIEGDGTAEDAYANDIIRQQITTAQSDENPKKDFYSLFLNSTKWLLHSVDSQERVYDEFIKNYGAHQREASNKIAMTKALGESYKLHFDCKIASTDSKNNPFFNYLHFILSYVYYDQDIESATVSDYIKKCA